MNYASLFQKGFIVFSILVLILTSCGKDGNSINLDKYIGEHQLIVTHITGVHEQYDSIGNVLGLGFDTIRMKAMDINITQQENTDSLTIGGLILTHLLGCCGEVKGVVNNDTLWLTRNKNTILKNDYVDGHIVFTTDSIHISYLWNKSDVWATSVPPTFGTVEGSGVQ